jgi:hypothetical protein
VVDQLAAAIQSELPAWATVFATLLLACAAAIARRITRRSARPQGERLGALERLVKSERTRRQQAERELYERYGIELPYWPPDGPNQSRPAPEAPAPHLSDEQEPPTARAPSIPALPDFPHHRR